MEIWGENKSAPHNSDLSQVGGGKPSPLKPSGQDLIRKFVHGGGLGEFSDVLRVENDPVLPSPVLTAVRRASLHQIGARISISPSDVDLIIEGRATVGALVSLGSMADVGSLASAAYLDSVHEHAFAGRAPDFSIESAILTVRKMLQNREKSLPPTFEQFLFDKLADPELVRPTSLILARDRELDDSYNRFVREVFGRFATQLGSPLPEHISDPYTPETARIPLQSGNDIVISALPKHDAFSKLLGVERDSKFGTFEDVMSTAIKTVFAVRPPLIEERLYTLAAVAVAIDEKGLSAAAWPQQVSSLEPEEVHAISFLRGELHVSQENQAQRCYEFYETLGDRPFTFEDLSTAACLSQTIKLLRSEASQSGVTNYLPLTSTNVAEALQRHHRAFCASYLHDRDLQSIPDATVRKQIHHKVIGAQQLGLVETRGGALSFARILSGIKGLEFGITKEMRMRTGADIRQFVRMLPSDESTFQNYSVRKFTPSPRSQFHRGVAFDEVKNECFSSQNYPALVRELQKPHSEVSINDIHDWISHRTVSSLVELEAFCAHQQWLRNAFAGKVKGSLKDALEIASSCGIVALVERQHDLTMPAIALALGHQSTTNHVGQGLRHVLHQRMESGALLAFRREGEEAEATIQRFIDDAVIFVAGSGKAVVPSARFPNSHVLLSGPVREMSDHFVTLVLARTADPTDAQQMKTQIVTALYHTGASVMRAYLLKELRGWAHGEFVAKRDFEKSAATLLANVNAMLSDAGCAPILLGELTPFPAAGAPAATARSGGGPRFNYCATASQEKLVEPSKSEPERARMRAVLASASLAPEEPTPPAPDDYYFSEQGIIFNPGFAAAI